MSAIFRFLAVGSVVTVFIVFGTTASYAQDPCGDTDAIIAADAKVRENYPKIETLKVAVDAGIEYLQKYGTCDGSKDFVAWLKPQIPVWEKQVKDYEEYQWAKPRYEKFNNGIKTSKFDDSYAAGAELLTKYPNNMNIILPLGLIGLYESYKNNFKYNEDSIRYAKMAISKFKAGGVESKKDKDRKPILDQTGKEVYGSYQFERNQEEALSELTYTLAYLNYHAKKDRKAALPYYYEVSQMPGAYKNQPRLYVTLGSYYGDESAPIGKEIIALIEKQKAASTDEEKEKLDVEIKAKVALFNGYSERALDAYGRAYNIADEKVASEKKLKDDVYKTLQALYEQRFEKKDGLAAYILTSTSKPLPNPTSEVTPIADPEPKTTTTGKTAPAAKPAATSGKTATSTKP
jgi:hypothetical protein